MDHGDNDSSISTTPEFTNGGTSSSGPSEVNTGNGAVELPGGLKVFIDTSHGGSNMPAILVETAFINHAGDAN